MGAVAGPAPDGALAEAQPVGVYARASPGPRRSIACSTSTSRPSRRCTTSGSRPAGGPGGGSSPTWSRSSWPAASWSTGSPGCAVAAAGTSTCSPSPASAATAVPAATPSAWRCGVSGWRRPCSPPCRTARWCSPSPSACGHTSCTTATCSGTSRGSRRARSRLSFGPPRVSGRSRSASSPRSRPTARWPTGTPISICW